MCQTLNKKEKTFNGRHFKLGTNLLNLNLTLVKNFFTLITQILFNNIINGISVCEIECLAI